MLEDPRFYNKHLLFIYGNENVECFDYFIELSLLEKNMAL